MKKQPKKTQVKNVYKQFTAVLWKEDNWYVATTVEVEVASQGKTKKAALANLKEALELYFEDNPNPPDIDTYEDVTLEKITVLYA